MAFWNKKDQSSSVVWRDKNGTISCPGDSCPQKCDDRCPIWLNTEALSLLQRGPTDEAVDCLKKAIVMAPDLADAYNNLGSAYGMSNRHQDAYEAFKKALECRKDYPKALFGLIVSAKNLGRFDEALHICDKLDTYAGMDSKGLRKSIQDAMSEQNAAATESSVSIAENLLELGRSEGFIESQGVTFIPELMVRSGEVCRKILAGLGQHRDKGVDYLGFCLVWSAFAGMGAVFHWYTDWAHLSVTGIYESLTAPRGIDEMDEYVLDSIGFPFGSKEANELTELLRRLSTQCIDTMISKFDRAGDKKADMMLENCKAMFLFGMVYEMNKLDMR